MVYRLRENLKLEFLPNYEKKKKHKVLMGVLLVPDTVMRKCISIPKMSYILKTENTSSFRVLINNIKVKHYLINISIIY